MTNDEGGAVYHDRQHLRMVDVKHVHVHVHVHEQGVIQWTSIQRHWWSKWMQRGLSKNMRGRPIAAIVSQPTISGARFAVWPHPSSNAFNAAQST